METPRETLETICLLYDKKLRDFNKADVAELVDARDLKSPGTTEITHLSDLTRAGNPHEAGGDPAVLSNTPPPLPPAGRSSKTWANVFLTETSARSSTLRSLDKSARVEGTFSPSPTIGKVTFAPAGQQDAAETGFAAHNVPLNYSAVCFRSSATSRTLAPAAAVQ